MIDKNERIWPTVLAYLVGTVIVAGVIYAIFGDTPRASF